MVSIEDDNELRLPDHPVIRGALSGGLLDIDRLESLEADHVKRMLHEMTADPEGYFSRDAWRNWDRYLGISHGPVWVRSWAHRVVRESWPEHPDTFRIMDRVYAEQWPLPVGRQALADYQRFAEGYLGKRLSSPFVSPALLPFEGTERASWIFAATIEDTRIEAFALVSPGTRVWKPGPLRFRITGNPTERVQRLCDGIVRWHQHLISNAAWVGRKRGSTRPSRAQLVEYLALYLRSESAEPKSRDRFLDARGYSLTTWNGWMKEMTTNFTSLKAEAMTLLLDRDDH